jgi:hypothetical protein
MHIQMAQNFTLALYSAVFLSTAGMASQESYFAYGHQPPDDLTGIDQFNLRVDEQVCRGTVSLRFAGDKMPYLVGTFSVTDGKIGFEFKGSVISQTAKLDQSDSVAANPFATAILGAVKDQLPGFCQEMTRTLQEVKEEARASQRPEPEDLAMDVNLTSNKDSCHAILSARNGEATHAEGNAIYRVATKELSLKFKQEGEPEVNLTFGSQNQSSPVKQLFPNAGKGITGIPFLSSSLTSLPETVCMELHAKNKFLWQLLDRTRPKI